MMLNNVLFKQFAETEKTAVKKSHTWKKYSTTDACKSRHIFRLFKTLKGSAHTRPLQYKAETVP